jgi:hypothetical protein
MCSVCANPQLAAVTRDLAAGVPYRDIAATYSLPRATLQRHAVECLRLRRNPGSSKEGSPQPKLRPVKEKLGGGIGQAGKIDRSRPVAPDDEGRCPSCGLLSADPDPKALVKRAERLLWLAESIAAKARKEDDARMALQAIDRARPMLEQLLKVHGMLQPDGATVIDQRQVHLTNIIAGKSDEELEALLLGIAAQGKALTA